MTRDEVVETMARAAHESRVALCWGPQFVGKREPWPDFSDPKVARAYPHNPLSYVDIARAEQRAALSALEAKGLVVVPREPTEAMKWCHEMPHIGPDEIAELYRAMLAAFEKQGG